MSIDSQQLMELLPGVHRIRDAEIAQQLNLEQGPLEELVSIIAEQMAIMEENAEQSYDDMFIETCSDWLTPYIGDLIGYQTLHGNVPGVASPREEVGHTIALRRRKGTAVVLEQLARDVTGWDARAVEFFQYLGWTQNANHDRDAVHFSPDMRNHEALSRIGSAFNTIEHSVDVRRVQTGKGRFNIQNVGIFLWRLGAYRYRQNPGLRLASRRYLISPLGHDFALYSRPISGAGDFISELSTPVNVAEPLKRRQAHDHLAVYYGQRESIGSAIDNTEPAILLEIDGGEIPRDQIRICNLSDDGPAWAHTPNPGTFAIDPELGRIALPPDVGDPAEVLVTYHAGFSADMGGGEYERQSSFALQDSTNVLEVPGDHTSVQDALDALGGNGVVEITDNGRYEESLVVEVAADAKIEIRAANNRRPHLVLTGPISLSGAENSSVAINGCLVSGNQIVIPDDGTNQIEGVELIHCTFVPGASLNSDGSPTIPGAISVRNELAGVRIEIVRSIVGAIRAVAESTISVTDSMVDATDVEGVALADLDDAGAGAVFGAEASTVRGKIHAREFGTVSNCILMARLLTGDTWNAPVWVERKQTGCIRFSFVPFESIVPRRFRCQPDSLVSSRRIFPHFTSLVYGQPAYGQLARTTPNEIWRGADDESEMGVFHHLFAPQRESNLRIRLQEYLRVGLEAGLIYES